LLAVSIVAALVSVAGEAGAISPCTKNWVGAANGAFSTASNWAPSGTPGSSDIVCSSAGSSIVVRQNANVRLPMLSGSLRINAGITFTDANNIGDPAVVGAINNLMLQGTLAIDAMAVLDLSGSSLVEGGTIAQTYDFLSQAYVRVPGGASMTVGSGRMTLRTTAPFFLGTRLLQVDGTLNLAGGNVTVAPGGGQLLNRGTLNWTSGNVFLTAAGAEIANFGTLNIDGTTARTSNGLGRIVNNSTGSLTHGSTATTTLNAALSNLGTVMSFAGVLNLPLVNQLDPVNDRVTGGVWIVEATLRLPANMTIVRNAGSITLGQLGSIQQSSGVDGFLLQTNEAPGTVAIQQTRSLGVVVNQGVLRAASGSLTVSAYTQTAGTTEVMKGATLVGASGPVQIVAGEIGGLG